MNEFYLVALPIILQWTIPVLLLVVGWLAGRWADRAHLRRLAAREAQLASITVTDLRNFPLGAQPQGYATLVVGESVVANDYMKRFRAAVRKIFGGEMHSYYSLLWRARREAMVRMLESARLQGFDAVCNVRLITADTGGAGAGKGIEVIAYGTAYRLPPQADPSAVHTPLPVHS